MLQGNNFLYKSHCFSCVRILVTYVPLLQIHINDYSNEIVDFENIKLNIKQVERVADR